MKRVAVSTTVAGLLALGMAGTLTLAPPAGGTTRFVTGGAHTTRVTPAVEPTTRVKPGSVWTFTAPGPGGGCNVWTFASTGNTVTTDNRFSGTWSKPNANTIKAIFPKARAKYRGKYSSGVYTGNFTLDGVTYPDSSLTPGATSGC